jgi:peroxiredoxin family protein
VLAVILESAEPERLYTGLSLIVSADEARGLATFGALTALVDPDIKDAPHVLEDEREAFARTLEELRTLAAPRIWACSAAVQATGADPSGLAGVISIPSFINEVKDAQLVVV